MYGEVRPRLIGIPCTLAAAVLVDVGPVPAEGRGDSSSLSMVATRPPMSESMTDAAAPPWSALGVLAGSRSSLSRPALEV